VRGLVLFAAVAVGAAPGVAHAGRSFFGWLQATEVMPERSVELQNWTGEKNKYQVNDAGLERSESVWGVAPFIGITDQLELNLPLDIVWGKTNGMPGNTALFDYGAELRYRFVTMDPEDTPPLAPTARFGVKRMVLDRDVLRSELGLATTYEVGSVVLAADLMLAGNFTRDDRHFEAIGGAGVSVLAVGDLRFNAELISQLSLDDKGQSWAAVGPGMSWTHGRFWVSAMYGIGVYQIKDAPRMQWGIAF